jgi:hypothetical protein
MILQTYESASQSEIQFAYERLKKQYQEDRFLPGEAGADAARNLSELEEAYREVMQKFDMANAEADFGSRYGVIENLIKQNKTNDAQVLLDDIYERNAEWHYLQSIIFYKKNWFDESKTQLETAVQLEPSNEKYKDALSRLNVFMTGQAGNTNAGASARKADARYDAGDGQNANQNNNRYNNQNNNQYDNRYNRQNYNDRQMGGCGTGGTENCCLQLLCADCCCECMGGDLIACC